jgi:hypothetical protein
VVARARGGGVRERRLGRGSRQRGRVTDSGLLAGWQERLDDYPDALAAERIEKAAERWGGFAPEGLLTIVRPDSTLARTEWLVESAQRVLTIVFALNRVHQPTAKRLSERVEPLAIKPERLAERIEETLAEPDPRTALRLMTELQLDTVRLAPSGPNVVRARRWLAQGLAVPRRVSVVALTSAPRPCGLSASTNAQKRPASCVGRNTRPTTQPAVAAAVGRVLGDETPDATSCFAHTPRRRRLRVE